jgi:membrane peptidoglycan carboxypeptidase
MSAQKSTAKGLLGGVLGTLGFSALAGLLVTVMVAPALAVTGMTANNSIGIFSSLPDYIELDSQHQVNQIVAMSADGVTEIKIAEVYDQNREEVTLDQISEHLQNAAIDGEDRRFRTHGGVDIPSVIRAAIGQVSGADGSGGASTLSMQLVRNTLVLRALNNEDWTEEKRREEAQKAIDPDLDRKLKEMKLAISLEKRYTKDEILAAYLNIVGMGGNSYGVQAGAQQFFNNIPASEVTPAQAASLIAIVQNPNKNSLNDPENYARNEARRNVILGFMFEAGHLTRAEYKEAIATKVDETFVQPLPPQNGCLAAAPEYRWPCEYALRSIKNGDVPTLGATPAEQRTNFTKGGYKIYLTIVPELQAHATAVVQQWAPKDETRMQLGAAASTVQVNTGRILIMAENKDFDNRDPLSLPEGLPIGSTAVNFNADEDHGGGSGFQPGSSYKPYTLLAFLAAGHGLRESFDAGKLELNQAQFQSCEDQFGGKYPFRNDSNEKGSYTVERGTAGSVNSVFLQMATKVDQCDIKKLAASLGVHKAYGDPDGSKPGQGQAGGGLDTAPSCAIGGCENTLAPITQAAAYAAIANQGIYCKPIIIDQVIDEDGKELGGQDAACGQSLVQPNVANTAAYAMAGVFNGGTANASNPRDGTAYIGKTGTTDDSIHVWLVGSSTAASTAVWVGNIAGKQPLRKITIQGRQGALLRHAIFKPLALAIDGYFPGGAFPAPDPALLTGNQVFVPELAGLTPEQAKTQLELVDLNYVDGGQIDSDQPLGTVAGTDPGAGAQIPRGTEVRVFTSNGEASAVPDVVSDNQDFPAAENELDQAGFENVDQVCVAAAPTDPPESINKVVAQNPAAGSVVNKNTTITLTVRKNVCLP